jgi:hypothetical protein
MFTSLSLVRPDTESPLGFIHARHQGIRIPGTNEDPGPHLKEREGPIEARVRSPHDKPLRPVLADPLSHHPARIIVFAWHQLTPATFPVVGQFEMSILTSGTAMCPTRASASLFIGCDQNRGRFGTFCPPQPVKSRNDHERVAR